MRFINTSFEGFYERKKTDCDYAVKINSSLGWFLSKKTQRRNFLLRKIQKNFSLKSLLITLKKLNLC